MFQTSPDTAPAGPQLRLFRQLVSKISTLGLKRKKIGLSCPESNERVHILSFTSRS